MKTTYNKLIRDNIPDIIQAAGKSCKVRTLDTADFDVELRRKLEEETRELKSARTQQQLIEELADIEEIVQALLKLHGSDKKQLERTRQKKAAENGAFKKRLFLVEVDEKE